ncbi:MAG TPA: FUSC family protein [Haloferula sp.]
MNSPDAAVLPLRRKAADLLPKWWDGAGFALRGMAATALALWVCILLNLKTPYTAALTVWVVANTRHGHVVAKSFHRVCGTLIGGAFAVALVAFLGSTPELLLLCLALWVGCCTGLGNLLRHYRSYFGFLAGYTAAFIVLGAYHHPDHVVETALDRTASIVIGVLSISLVGALFSKRAAAGETSAALVKLHADCLDILSRFREIPAADWSGIRLRLNKEFLQAEDQLEFADVESHGFRRRASRQRAISRFLIDLVEVSRVAAIRSERSDAAEAVEGVFRDIVRSLEAAKQAGEERQLQHLLTSLRCISGELQSHRGEIKEVIEPLIELLERSLPRLQPASLDRQSLSFPLHLDLRGALRYGLRTTLTLLLAIGFWAMTGWNEGPAFVFNCAAFCALNAGMSHPGKSLAMIAVSAAFAATAGFFLKFHLLPHASGFPSLILCLAVVLVPIAFMTRSRNPWIAVTGATGGFLVLALVQPVNHMSYNPAAYLSSSIATVFAALFAIPAFSLILPTRAEKEADRLLRNLRRKVIHASSSFFAVHSDAWRVTAGDLLVKLPLNPLTTPAQLEDGLRNADIGAQLVRLRNLKKSVALSPECEAAVARVFEDAGHTWRRPQDAIASAKTALGYLREDSRLTPPQRRSLVVPLEEYRRLLSSLALP